MIGPEMSSEAHHVGGVVRYAVDFVHEITIET